MKKLLYLLLVFVLIFSLAGCMGRGSEDISVLYYTFSDTYISSVRSALDKALKSAGVGYHNYDANGNQTTQTEQVDTAIAKGTRLLLVNIVDTGSDDAARAIVEKAKNAGIPVIFFNRSVSTAVLDSYDRCYFIGTDYEEAGKLQGEMIAKYLLEKYNEYDINSDGVISYVLFKGQQGNSEAEARTRYAVEVCNRILLENGKSEIRFYDKSNTNGYLVDQDGTWSSGAANNYMKTILTGYSEASGNMVELVIANNDEMALGAISALTENGYNTGKSRHIPVFGVDATDAAVAKIKDGAMAGTVKQDAEGMAMALSTVSQNLLADKDAMTNVKDEMIVSEKRINIPYSPYTGKEG